MSVAGLLAVRCIAGLGLPRFFNFGVQIDLAVRAKAKVSGNRKPTCANGFANPAGAATAANTEPLVKHAAGAYRHRDARQEANASMQTGFDRRCNGRSNHRNQQEDSRPSLPLVDLVSERHKT